MKLLLISLLLMFPTFAKDVRVVIDGQRYYCSKDGSPPRDREYRCVPRCEDRNFLGNCRTYGSDFCGYDAVCIKHCSDRDMNGNCRDYSADICRSSQD